MKAPSIIVYGPPGSGKTLRAKQLQENLGLDRVHDDYAPNQPVEAEGVLYLSNSRVLSPSGFNPTYHKGLLVLRVDQL